MSLLELFPDLAEITVAVAGDGCTRPVGRRGDRRPRWRATGTRVPSITMLLAEMRVMLRTDLEDIAASLRRLERGARMQLEMGEATTDVLERVLVRLVRLERAAGVVKDPAGKTPKNPNGSRWEWLEPGLPWPSISPKTSGREVTMINMAQDRALLINFI